MFLFIAFMKWVRMMMTFLFYKETEVHQASMTHLRSQSQVVSHADASNEIVFPVDKPLSTWKIV